MEFAQQQRKSNNYFISSQYLWTNKIIDLFRALFRKPI